MKKILKTENLTKQYSSMCVVSDVNLEIEHGQVFGILGSNGSGKTTILSMIVGTTNPTAGNIWWFGESLTHKSMKKIGCIIEGPSFYPYMSAQKNLELNAHIKKIDKRRIPEVLEDVGLLDRQNDRYNTFSLGMKQRLAIAAALLNNPEVLILDEPTNGLDPMGISSIREIIKKISSNKKTVILASHLLDEVQKICTHFSVLDKGKVIHNGSIKEIEEENEVIEVGVENQEMISSILGAFQGTQSMIQEGKYYLVTLTKGTKSYDLNNFLSKKNIVVSHLSVRKKTLEKEFLKILKTKK